MSISPVGAIGSLVSPSRGSSSDPEPTPTKTQPAESGRTSPATSSATPTETKTAVQQPPSATTLDKVVKRPQNAPAISGHVLPPNEFPETEEIIELKEARERAAVLQESAVMERLIAALELAARSRQASPVIEKEVPEASEEAPPPQAQEDSAEATVDKRL